MDVGRIETQVEDIQVTDWVCVIPADTNVVVMVTAGKIDVVVTVTAAGTSVIILVTVAVVAAPPVEVIVIVAVTGGGVVGNTIVARKGH